LVYIHWFQPLQSFDKHLQSFWLTRSLCQCGPNTVIVPVSQVLCLCHLIPCVGQESDMHKDFYLNRYIDLELFDHLSV
ncbi:hypothetical protein BDR06DRAFT_896010, partial [Suillus hirtellus]